MTHVLAYLRCSTSAQDLDSQRRQITAWAAANGHSVAYYEDDAQSGRRADRAGLADLLLAADTRAYPFVVVTELSRIGRSIAHVHQVIERLTESNVKIVLASTGAVLSYSTLEGRALVGALALAADIEFMLSQERRARGRATIAAKNIKVGRKPRPISDTVLRALQAQGLSVRQIARELNEAPSTVGRRLQALDRAA